MGLLTPKDKKGDNKKNNNQKNNPQQSKFFTNKTANKTAKGGQKKPMTGGSQRGS